MGAERDRSQFATPLSGKAPQSAALNAGCEFLHDG
jgi:hypothetical protein